MISCAACGRDCPPEFSFCGYCGAPLQAPTPAGPSHAHESRRSVTVVFSDLKGSTSLGERLDSEALREVMTRYFSEMSLALEHHGGTVEKFIGDAIMAVFGMPHAHEDDALRAVRAALEMSDRLAVLNEELERVWGVRLENRTGVNTGPVIASGDASSRQRLVTGDTVNVAARLEQAAAACEVLIGEPTYRLVRDAVEVEAVEPLELKGKSERVPAYRLLAVAEVGKPPGRHDLPLVGRESELALLVGALAAAIAGPACGLVTILAEAGTGKTRLIEELVARVGEHGGRAVSGRCLPYGRGITFWPLVEMVRDAAEIAGDDHPEAARAKILALVGDGAVADRVAAAVGLSETRFPLDELYWGARKLFEALARSGPLVAILEDVHWAETALLELVSHVASTATGAPILLVCSLRPGLEERHPEWPEVDGVTKLRLGPLAVEDVDRMVEHLLGGALAAEARTRIAHAAEGNPLFVEQLVSMFVDEGALRAEGDHWVAVPDFAERVAVPASIDALLAARLDLLPPDELTVTESASVIGLEFPREPVDELVPASLGAVTEQLERLEAKGLVRPAAEAAETFRFHHIMIRDSAYNRLPKRARSRLHARFAGWAERVNRERDRELEFQEIVGYHLEQAQRYLAELAPLDEEGRYLGRRAAGHLGPAGRRAFARGDMWAAANLLRRAADLLPPGEPQRLEFLPDLGEALMEIGEFAQAQERLDEAVAAAAASGDTALEADAILTRLLVAHHTVTDLDAWRGEVQREADRLIPQLEEVGAAGVLAKAWRMVAFIHGTACRWQETGDALEHALRNARAAGDPRQLARLSASYVMALGEGPTPAPEAIARAEEVLALGLVDRQAEAVAVLALAPLYAMSGDITRGRELGTRAGELLRDLGATVLAARTSYVSARVELMAGEPAAAESRLRSDYDALTAMDERYFRPIIASLLAKSLYELNRLEEAADLAALTEEIASPDDVEALAVARAVRARLLAADGATDEARALALAAVELVAQTDAPVLRADVRMDAAEALAGATDERAALLEEARALYEQKQHLLGLARVEAELAAGTPVG